MKARRIIALVLLLCCLLTGCGGVAMDSAENGMVMDQEGLYEEAGSSTSGSGTSPELSDQKLITTVEVNAETEDLDTLMGQLTEQIAGLGGYIEYQNTYYGSAYSTYRHRSANMTIRIPADKLGDFLLHVEGCSNVISKQQSQDNVTLQYVDTESRMAALQSERDRLMELMDQAGDLSDLLKIEERLTDVLYELESTTAQLRSLDNQVSYATVELYIDEVKTLTETQEQTVWQRIGSGFGSNLRQIGEDLVDFFVWVVTYSPQLLIFAGVIALIVWLVKRFRRSAGSRKMPKTPYVPPKAPEDQT